jgi:hypothetical protein
MTARRGRVAPHSLKKRFGMCFIQLHDHQLSDHHPSVLAQLVKTVCRVTGNICIWLPSISVLLGRPEVPVKLVALPCLYSSCRLVPAPVLRPRNAPALPNLEIHSHQPSHHPRATPSFHKSIGPDLELTIYKSSCFLPMRGTQFLARCQMGLTIRWPNGGRPAAGAPAVSCAVDCGLWTVGANEHGARVSGCDLRAWFGCTIATVAHQSVR